MSLFTERTEKVIEVADWDALVTETYGRPYSFQQQDGCKCRDRESLYVLSDPDLVYDFDDESVPEIVNGDERGVSFEAWLARDPNQLLNELRPDWDTGVSSLRLWWERNFYPTSESVAHDLFKRGLLEEGEYVINIDW